MKKILLTKIKVAIVVHESTPDGPGHHLRDVLLKNGVSELLFIAHPLLYFKEGFKKSSRYELYKDGRLIKERIVFHWVLPESLLYIKDVFYTIFWCFAACQRFDIFFGVGNLNAFSGYILKLFRCTNKVIYYVIDYVPQRFDNKLLNGIYHRVEKFCAEHSDWTWNLSPRMIEGRSKKWGKEFPNQLVVPHGVYFERIKRVPFEKVNRTEIIYMGVLLKKQGIQLVIKSLPQIIKKIPEIKFTIIGRGPYRKELKRLINRLGLKRCVEFLGYIPSHQEMENRLARAAIGIALYSKKYDQFSYFADPGKIKTYLGAGVPVVMTDVPFVARQVEKARCGFVVSYSKDELTETLINFFSNEEMIKNYRMNALEFAKGYDWEKIFMKALAKVHTLKISG